MRHRIANTETARMRMLAAKDRLDRLLKETRFGGQDLPDDTLDLVAGCMNAIAEVIERRRDCDAQQRPIAVHELMAKTKPHPRH
jgi:hypothetical protein